MCSRRGRVGRLACRHWRSCQPHPADRESQETSRRARGRRRAGRYSFQSSLSLALWARHLLIVRRNTVSIDRIVTVDFIFVVNFAGAAAHLTATDAAEDAVRHVKGDVDRVAAFGAAWAVVAGVWWVEMVG